ncbi:MAG TPA: DUF4142 domain-containing protein [Candidatus Methylacidiphilales bacterium]|nr:DUF4142 domain-containing protein [Candidatus Methylacidiphilales bacterium]
MKTRLKIRTFLLAGMSAASLAFIPALYGQSTTTTNSPANPSGSEETSKPANDSVAQQRNEENGNASQAATPASAPDTTSSKDATNSLDQNPSMAPTGSAEKSATKDDSNKKSSPQAFSDEHFLIKAQEGGLTEVHLGQIAQQNGSSDQVKQFGARMVADHSKANDALKNLAQQKGVNLPEKLDASHQAMVNRLSKLSGSAFDRAYIRAMVKDHQEDAAEFKEASASTQDPDVKAFASKTLSLINDHLADAKNIQSGMK